MSEAQGCSRCGGVLVAGKLRHFAEHGGRTHFWCPWEEPLLTGSNKGRREVAVFCCQNCGHMEMFAGQPEAR